jgi:D-alanyl-D-alanine carboxypeptidase
MKKTTLYLPLIAVLITGCGKYVSDLQSSKCNSTEATVPNYTKADELEELLEQLTQQGVPGVAIAVQSDEGLWSSAKGYAKIEDETPMQVCHLQYLQSISKTYMAVAILKLVEQEKINLDSPMTNYLPKKYNHYVKSGEKVTVRMLLNHTSGIPEYNFQPAYVSYFLQHPDHYFTTEDYLDYIKGKDLVFTPGSKHLYTNTNYEILALICDSLAGDHARFISETIFKPLGLTNTFYRNEKDYLQYDLLPNSYWDRFSNGIVENVSLMQRTNVSTLIGDDGIVTTPADAVKFLRGLADGKLLSANSMQQMLTWVSNKQGKPVYGLGLGYRKIEGVTGYGHSGGGIGAGCELYYFPQKNLCYFIAINLGTVTESPLHAEIGHTLEKLHEVLLR